MKNDKSYHFRIHKKTQYIIFGDIDYYNNSIDTFILLFSDFLKKYYKLELNKNDLKYTQNNVDNRSFHYSIPKWNASTEKLKEK